MKAGMLVLLLFAVYQIGFYQAHKEIGRECQILGGFYIATPTITEHYQCSLKDEK